MRHRPAPKRSAVGRARSSRVPGARAGCRIPPPARDRSHMAAARNRPRSAPPRLPRERAYQRPTRPPTRPNSARRPSRAHSASPRAHRRRSGANRSRRTVPRRSARSAPRHIARRLRPDRSYPRAGVRRGNDGNVLHARQRNVGGETAAPRHEARVFLRSALLSDVTERLSHEQDPRASATENTENQRIKVKFISFLPSSLNSVPSVACFGFSGAYRRLGFCSASRSAASFTASTICW